MRLPGNQRDQDTEKTFDYNLGLKHFWYLSGHSFNIILLFKGYLDKIYLMFFYLYSRNIRAEMLA